MTLYQVTLDFSSQTILKEYAENSPLKIQIFTLSTKQLYSLVLFMRWVLNYKDLKYYFFVWQVKEIGEKENE